MFARALGLLRIGFWVKQQLRVLGFSVRRKSVIKLL